jgi:nicotinic acid mononucleotide adenylyltransferase
MRATAPSDAEVLFSNKFIRLLMSALAISASQMRGRVAHPQRIRALVPQPVARYIADHHHY